MFVPDVYMCKVLRRSLRDEYETCLISHLISVLHENGSQISNIGLSHDLRHFRCNQINLAARGLQPDDDSPIYQ